MCNSLRISNLLVLSVVLLSGQKTPTPDQRYGNIPLSFEANQGQTDPQVKFLSHGQNYSLFLTGSEAVFAFQKKGKGRDVVRMQLIGAKHSPEVSGINPLPGKANYFIGNDPAQWRSNVPTYGRVRYKNVYPGVDLVYYGNQKQLEYDFVVGPDADPARIQFRIDGQRSLKVDENANLLLGISDGEILVRAPLVYQDSGGRRQAVKGSFRMLTRSTVGFALGEYDRSRPLVIDPTLAYSSFLGGGSGINSVRGIVIDAVGNAYLTGDTDSSNFPVTPGAYQDSAPNPVPYNYAFVTKLNQSGIGLVYSTYLGGSSDAYGTSIAVDTNGNAFVCGLAQGNFPTTAGAFQTSSRGGTFVTKLDSAGASLIFSTFFGSVGGEFPVMTIDSSGNAYIAGPSASNFPVTPGAFQTHNNGLLPASVIGKLNASGSGLIYATFLNGSVSSFAGLAGTTVSGIAVNEAGETFVTGNTTASDFPTTLSSFEPNVPATASGLLGVPFVSRLNSAGSDLIYSTYVGDGGLVTGIALDSSNSA